MNYSRAQKWLSSFLIFSLLFLQTFEIPMLNFTRAEARVSADIISFIVDEAIYNGVVKSRVLQYAQDIQAYLPNTRVVIFPIEKTINPFDIASINEKLFYEGDGEGLSRLIGTILIGEVPLPVVHKDGRAFMSLYPYVDFDTKSFIYDQSKRSYEYTTNVLTDEKPEIWHSVIRPNTGNASKNTDELVTFFNKTHDFYNKQGLFSTENTPQEPRVFYMDTFHDQETSSPEIWKSYNLYLENIEDISYRRFSKYLAKKLYDASQNFYSIDSASVKDPAIKTILETYSGTTTDLSKAPDITTKDIIEKSVKQFFEVFNAKYMGDVLRYIHNAGRYGDANNVRADSAPVVIAKKDLFMRTTLKDANTSLEGVIDALLQSKLAEPLKVATYHKITSTSYAGTKTEGSSSEGGSAAPSSSSLVSTSNSKLYKNYFFGQNASTITNVNQCTIVRGSSLKVESNRGYAVRNAETDAILLQADLPRGACFPASTAATFSYWGGNSPLSFDLSKMQRGEIALKPHTYKNFVKSIYDAGGSRELETNSPLHIATPQDCFDNNMLLQPYVSVDAEGIQTGWPSEKNGTDFSCITEHKVLAPFENFYTYNTSLPSEECTISKLELDGRIVKQSGSFCDELAGTINVEKIYGFKTLSHYIMEHKSPTDEEYGIQLKDMVTPSLPADRERYVDYLDKSLTYQKIVYPNFFRIVLDGTELDYPGATKKIKELLDAKTAEITNLGGDVDLYKILSADEKALNAVVEGVLWNNMKNATLKYSNTLERSLNIDGEKKISSDDKKNDYEIAYLGAPGDAKNMYLKVDPDAKNPPPKEIADIFDQVNTYRGLIDGSNITNTESSAEFKCGPPEGVPIWEWLPAIFCWLGEILPPTISGGSCGGPNISTTNTQGSLSLFRTPANALDANKNGILDGYELIGNGVLNLHNPEKVFSYGETISLDAELTKDGKIIDIDDFNVVSFGIKQLKVISNDKENPSRVVYDRDGTGTIADIENITPYINFKPIEIRAQQGRASYSFSSKNTDIDVTFDTHIFTKDRYQKVVTDLHSKPVTFSVRSERISVLSKIKVAENPFTLSSVIEAGNPNGILFNLKKINKDQITLSDNLPYILNIYDDIDNKQVHDPINVSKNEYLFRDPALLLKSGVYRFEFIDKGGIKGFTTVTVLPALPTKIEVTPSSNIFITGEKTTVLVRVLDSFGNPSRGEVYRLDGSISGGADFLDSDGKKLGSTTSKNIIEGYASFDITNTKSSNEMKLSFRIDRANVSSDVLTLRSIDSAKISIEVEDRDAIVVGKEKHSIRVKILDVDGQLMTGYNGVLSLDFPKLSGTISTPFVRIKNGISETDIDFTPGYVAEKNLRIQAQIPGIKNIEGDILTVLPDSPMSFSFAKEVERIEAKAGGVNNTRATLYDRYGNIAYNTTGYTLALSIPEDFKKYAILSETQHTFSGGILNFNIGTTALPGKAYIIGTVSPGLESNSFTITDKSKKSLTIHGISQNVTVLDTYYVFNKSKLDTMRYDAHYSMLLGGDYGDITTPEYLGGEILFNHDSKSLAVTTLLNNPWKDKNLFGFTPAGKYSFTKEIDDTESIQVSIGNNEQKSYISFYDAYRKEYIARAWLNIDPSITQYLPCTSSGIDISTCQISDKTTIFMKGFEENVTVSEDGGLVLYSSNKIPLVRINKDGKIAKYPGIEIELDEESVSNLLGMKITSNKTQIGYIGIKFASSSLDVTSSSLLEQTLVSKKNQIVLEFLSNRYSSHKTHLGVSSLGSQGIMFAFQDVTSGEIGTLDTAYVARSGISGLESYPKQTGIGWENDNRTLLEVASGTPIGNATKFYQTFSTITLGDAVSHLPKISTTSDFDHTIGTQIATGNGERIESYKKIDVNGDSIPDMVIFYESGKIQLLINYAGSFKDMGFLAYVSDGGKGRKGVGNFFNDRYDDIVLVDIKGRLVLLDNRDGKFTRTTPYIINESGTVDNLHGYVQQLEIFDMDHDGKDDIVTLDDSGEINILYGTVRDIAGKKEYIFTKKLIESGMGMRLSKDVRNDGGAFNYKGLLFPNQGTEPSGNIVNTETTTSAINQGMIDNIIYYQFGYQSDNNAPLLNGQKDTAIGSSIGSNIKKNPDGTYTEDAGKITFDASAGSSLTGTIDYSKGGQNISLTQEISSQIENIRNRAGTENTDFSALDNSNRGTKKIFIRSPFAEGKGLKVEKTYSLMTTESRDTLQTNDVVRVEIILTNTTTKTFQDATYLDSNDRNLFSQKQEGVYTISKNGGPEEQYALKYLTEGDFDYGFDFASIAPGESIKIRYLVNAIPATFGKMGVGLLEKGEGGDDIYGDISMSANNICGGEIMLWRSVEPFPRSYEKGIRKFADNSVLPEELQKNAIDLDKNGIPDYIDDLIKSGKAGGDINALKAYSNSQLNAYNVDKNQNSIPDRGDSKGSKVVSYNSTSRSIEIGGLSSGNIDAINGQIDEVVRGLGCGFGGGSCLSMPMNWAPLAPGTAPSIMGFPIGTLGPSTGFPVFSVLTGMPVGPLCIPSVWPVSPLDLAKSCGGLGAGGYLGDKGAANFFRLYVTPTITGAIGVAACFNSIPSVTGKIPPQGVSPLIPGGNCVVAAKPLLGCKDDGSDGDAGSLGLGMDSNNPFVNANACIKPSGNTALLPEDRNNLIKYVAGDNSHLPEINASMARGGLSSLSAGPLVGIGLGAGGESNFEVSIDATALKNFDFGNIVKIKNQRVSAFPDFLMDWASRQLEEVVNKLTSLPTLYIILPDFSGLDISGYKNFADKFSEGKSADGKDYASAAKSGSRTNNSTIGGAQDQYNSLVNNNAGTINSLGKNVSGVKAAYEFMSHLPLIKFENEMVDIAIPWLSFEEMDKWLINAKLTQKQWKEEFADKQEKWSRIGNLSEADKKVMVQTEGLIGTLQENINIIESYKRFPEKLQKYLTWKERYASQLLCNIEAIEYMIGGWIGENGKRFRAWVELYMLIKSILKSWQLIVDLFYGYEAECVVCRNERYDLKHFIMKIISAILPKIPIVQFPKWPDIWLDLHNIRGGLHILMPEYHFNFVPMVLPQLPRLTLPNVPTLGIGLPNLPILPRLPDLPNLPDLPSLPTITLPELPPPPTIPKLFGGIAAVLDIFKIVAKILCILRINPFVPEWRAGDQIAQITERQGTMPGLDFLNVEFPNFPLSFVDAIKVGSFVNLEFDIDFIVAMSKATLNPLNQFSNDLSNIGSIALPDTNFRDVLPDHVQADVNLEGYVGEKNKKPTKEQIMTKLLRNLSFGVLHNFIALNKYMETHASDQITVEGLRDILTENIALIRATNDPKAGAIVDVLQRAVSYKGEKETEFINNLSRQNTEKFRLIKDYVKSEQSETLRLKTEMDTILRTGTITKETTPTLISIGEENIKAQSLSTRSQFGDDIKQQILTTNDRIYPSLERIKNGGGDEEMNEIKELGNSLVSGVSKSLENFSRDVKRNDSLHTLAYGNTTNSLLALNTSESASESNANPMSATQPGNISPNASTYQYEGIYILDKNNKQVRLFDYIDLVDGDETLVYTDVDKDGDNDIIYRMDNSLYLKKNASKNAESSHFSDSSEVFSWEDFLQRTSDSDTTRTLSAPNHFEEIFSTSREIDFSFRPANALLDNLFRFEYYDYVDRFDRVNSGEGPLSIFPKTPLHKIDLIPDLSRETVVDIKHPGFIGRDNIVTFGRGSGEATVTMNTYQYITPETNGINPIIITEGRTIYADAGGATISYLRDDEKEPQTLVFARNTNYEFLRNAKIWVKSGKLYLFKESQEQKKVNAGDLYGMPVLPNTKVEVSGNGFTSFTYHDGTTLRLDGPGTYEYYPLGKKSEKYIVSLAAPNDWYYAKLSSIDKNITSTIASLNLLSPQKEADTTGPLITFGDTLKVPVYQKQRLNLQSEIEDISGIDAIWFDMDLGVDSDGDGNTQNDKDTLDTHTKQGMKKGNTIYDLDIEAFETLTTKKIRLFAEDGNGNISSKDITFIVYSPIPEIESLSGSRISGNIDESLIGEPVDIFRLRNGNLSRIESDINDPLLTKEGGVFALHSGNSEGIILTQSGKTIAKINERTGKITIEDMSFKVRVLPASMSSPLSVQVISPDGQVIFSEKLHKAGIGNIEQVVNLDSITGTGIMVSPTRTFSFIKNTSASPYLPDGGYLVDANHKALAGISKGGDIYLLANEYSLIYTSKDSYIVIGVQDSKGIIIANILYKIDAEYVIK